MAFGTEKLSLEDFLVPEPKVLTPAVVAPASTPLVGRAEELGQIIHSLSDPHCRIVTLVGPGGVGKSRLALEVTAQSGLRFTDGAFFVSLAPVKSPDLLASAVATALQMPSFGQAEMKKQVTNFLREKEMLLVLDNFEHLLEEADWLAKIKEEAPKVKFIVTSRESLGLKGEKILEIHGLKVPSDEHEVELERFGAVQLFLQLARQAQPDFQLTQEEKPFLVYLCQFLDGMPLGLELAAGWVKTLSIHVILAEIKKNRDFLVSTYGELPERHRSLRAAFEYSWNMLGPNQKEALRRIAVFPGAFQAEAAEFITGALVTQLALLADKSILHKNSLGRYEVHGLLKQYLDEKLEETPVLKAEVSQKHCLYFSNLLQRNSVLLSSPRQKEALEAVGLEMEDIRVAWDWVLEKKLHEEVEKFTTILHLFYDIRGLYEEGWKLFEKGVKAYAGLLKAEGPGATKIMRALYGDILGKWGLYCFRLGQTDKATELMRESLATLQKSGTGIQVAAVVNNLSFLLALVSGNFLEGQKLLEENIKTCEREKDQPGLALSLRNLGYIHWKLGNYTEARQLYHRSQNICNELGDSYALSIVLTETVNLVFDLSRYEEAEEICLQSLQVHKQIGHRSGLAWTQGKLGNIHWALGNYDIAKKLYETSLKTFRETGDREGIAWGANSLGHVLQSLGNGIWALESYKEGLTLYRVVNHRWGTAWSLANMGRLEKFLGRLPEAEKELREALGIFRDIRNPWGTAYVLEGLGQVLARQGQPEEALRDFEEALALFKKGDNLRDMALAHCHLGETYFPVQELEKAKAQFQAALQGSMAIFALPVVLQSLLGLAQLEVKEGKEEEGLCQIFLLMSHSAADWETREKARAFTEPFRNTMGAQKVVEMEISAKELNWKEVATHYLNR